MASVSTYLNFPRETEEAFNFYKSVFGGEFQGKGMMRFGDFPPAPGSPPMAKEDEKLVMNVSLEILGGHIIMGTDAPESMGFNLTIGSNVSINLHPDSKEETDNLFRVLSEGGAITMPLTDMFWGAYFGTLIDKFGIQWMFNFTESNK